MVVGAGIAGLTAALRLVEEGHDVRVVAASAPEQTTSSVAAALWYPYRALPREAVTRWSATTYDVLAGMAGRPDVGVRLRTGRELLLDEQPDPWWRDAVPALDRVPAGDLPAGFRDDYLLEVPVVDVSVHLPWLVSSLAARGVRLQDQELGALEQADPSADAVVNCTGLGAAALTGDEDLVPVQGQVVVVAQVGVQEWLLAQSDPVALTYVVPRERTVVLGGTAAVGATDLEPDARTAAAVLERCSALVPALRRAPVLAHRVGLRPTRSCVRLEVGRLADGRPVVHDYGHGGAGVTLSYGCAADVARLVTDL